MEPSTPDSQPAADAEFVAKPFRFKDNTTLPRKRKKKKKASTKTRVPHTFAEYEGQFGDQAVDGGDVFFFDTVGGRAGPPSAVLGRAGRPEGPAAGLSTAEEDEEEEGTGEAGPDEDADEAFADLVADALDTEDGALIWERVFGEPIARHTHLLEAMSMGEFVEAVKERLYAASTAPPGGDGQASESSDEEGEWWRHPGRGDGDWRDKKQREKEVVDKRKAREDAEIMARIAKLVAEEEQRKRELARWQEYLAGWRRWDGSVEKIPWPVPSGRRGDVRGIETSDVTGTGTGTGTGEDGASGEDGRKAIREWFLADYEAGRVERAEFVARLKGERVRWHPDRFCRRFGGQRAGGADPELVRDVTVVFQVLGGLWEEVRDGGGRGSGRQRR